MVKGKMADILTKGTSMEVNRKETADHYCLHIQAVLAGVLVAQVV